jgi:hypothetical protein
MKKSRKTKIKNKNKQKKKSSAPPSVWKSLGKEILGALPDIIGAISAFPLSNAHTSVTPGGGPMAQSMTASIPAANGAMVKTTVPSIRNRVNGVTVCHREFLSNVSAPPNEHETPAFNMAFMGKINPGNPKVFPWLATIAQRFESYLFKKLRFIYEMQAGTDKSGTIMIVIDYDTIDAPPASKSQMMAYVGATRSPPWFPCMFNAATGDLRKSKTYYVTQTEETPSGTDAKTYFVGNVYCATETGESASSQLFGELYVEYEVDLLTPVLDSFGGTQFILAGRYLGTGGTTPASSIVQKGSLPIVYETDAPSILDTTFYVDTPGLYMLEIVVDVIAGGQTPDFVVTYFPNTTVHVIATDNGVTPPFNGNVGFLTNSSGNRHFMNQFYVDSPPGGFSIASTDLGDDGDVFIRITPLDPDSYQLFGITQQSFSSYRAMQYKKNRTSSVTSRRPLRLPGPQSN